MVDPENKPQYQENTVNTPVQHPSYTESAPLPSAAIVPKANARYEERAIIPYKQRRHLPIEARSPTQSISLSTYFIWKQHGFHPKQTADIVRSAWDANRNLIRVRHVGEKFLTAMEEVMGDELDAYSATPEMFARLKEIANQVQYAKDLLMTQNFNVSYSNLFELRDYEPDEIVRWAQDLKDAGVPYPLWTLVQMQRAAKKSKVSLDNLVERRTNGENLSSFDGLGLEEGFEQPDKED